MSHATLYAAVISHSTEHVLEPRGEVSIPIAHHEMFSVYNWRANRFNPKMREAVRCEQLRDAVEIALGQLERVLSLTDRPFVALNILIESLDDVKVTAIGRVQEHAASVLGVDGKMALEPLQHVHVARSGRGLRQRLTTRRSCDASPALLGQELCPAWHVPSCLDGSPLPHRHHHQASTNISMLRLALATPSLKKKP